MIKKEEDPMGQAIYNFFHHKDETSVNVDTNITVGEELPVPYLFRTFDEMPLLEKKAMNLVKGSVLDVGAGAGTHSLYLQNNQFDVTSIDVSELSCEVMKSRGLKKIHCSDIWTFVTEPFDTVLFMMNGIGLVKNLEGLEPFLEHLKNYVKPNGQVLLDSSDLKYMFDDEEGGFWIDLHSNYYGELEYRLEYKGCSAKPFPWLFVDSEKLSIAATNAGWKVELIFEDEHFHYLVKLTKA
jgi:SAM-dependent methyltransferase